MAEKITISAPFSQESRSLGRIGRVGENLSRQIVFDCTGALTDRPNANIICVIQRTGDKEPYAAQMTRVGETGSYKLVLTSTEVAKSGSVRFELRMVDGEEILKAAIYTGTVEASMSGIGDTPGEPIPDALNRLETAIAEVGKYADLKKEVETLQTSGASTAKAAADAKNAADANAASIHGEGGTYDNTKGTIQARLNTLEAGDGLKVESTTNIRAKYYNSYSTPIGSKTIPVGGLVQSVQFAFVCDDKNITPERCIVQAFSKTGKPVSVYFSVLRVSNTYTAEVELAEVYGTIVWFNAHSSPLEITKDDISFTLCVLSEEKLVNNVSGNVIPGGAGDVTKSYVDSQDAALDAKITTAINAANANGVSIHGAGAAYDNTKGTIAARLEALEAGGGTSSTKIANGTGMAQVGTGKELVVDYSATGFTSAPIVVASHCQTGESDTDTSGVVKVLNVTKTGCKISIIGGTADHDYPVSWIATGT